MLVPHETFAVSSPARNSREGESRFEPRRVPPALRGFLVVVGLYAFAVAVTLMGSSFKLLGKSTAEGLLVWAQNPIVGLFVGLLMTSLVQSSSTVTTMIVTAVAGGLVPVPVAVPMVMGANIGTTVTNSLVAFGSVTRTDEFRRSVAAATVHDFFNLLAVTILLPLEVLVQATGRLKAIASDQPVGILGWLGDQASRIVPAEGVVLGVEKSQSGIGFAFKAPGAWVLDTLASLFTSGAHGAKSLMKAAESDPSLLGESRWVPLLGVLAGIGLLSACLVLISRNMRVLVLGRFEGALATRILNNPFACVVLGIVLTVLVQSSSITTSILVPVAAAGFVALRQVFLVTLGANIGTTCTGLLAALFLVTSGDSGARLGLSIATVHLLFNLAGIAIILGIPQLRDVPLHLARRFAALCAERKMVAVGYVLGVFFGLPGLLLLAWRGIETLLG